MHSLLFLPRVKNAYFYEEVKHMKFKNALKFGAGFFIGQVLAGTIASFTLDVLAKRRFETDEEYREYLRENNPDKYYRLKHLCKN